MAQAREGEAHVREGRAATREREIRSAETLQTATVDQMIRLQQANANLVVATPEACQLADEVQTAKIELGTLVTTHASARPVVPSNDGTYRITKSFIRHP